MNKSGNDITLFTVGLGDDLDSQNRARLIKLQTDHGGENFHVPDGQSVAELMKAMAMYYKKLYQKRDPDGVRWMKYQDFNTGTYWGKNSTSPESCRKFVESSIFKQKCGKNMV